MIDIDFDRFDAMTLDHKAFEVAADRATEAGVAGLDPATELEHGIKGYILALEKLGFILLEPGKIAVPKNLIEAEAMQRLGYAYIRQHDPMREI